MSCQRLGVTSYESTDKLKNKKKTVFPPLLTPNRTPSLPSRYIWQQRVVPFPLGQDSNLRPELAQQRQRPEHDKFSHGQPRRRHARDVAEQRPTNRRRAYCHTTLPADATNAPETRTNTQIATREDFNTRRKLNQQNWNHSQQQRRKYQPPDPPILRQPQRGY